MTLGTCLRLVAVFVLLAPAALAQTLPFAAPWVGYDAGSSAFPGNPDPYERDGYAIASADLDGDGDVDVVVANYDYAAPGGTDGSSGFAVLFNEGDGVFGEPVHYTFTTKGSFDVVVGDFDEDGHPDLALPNSGRILGEDGNTVVLFRNDGTGAFALAGEFLVGERPVTLAVGDLDGDGHLDLATANSGRDDTGRETMSVLWGAGDGAFSPAETYYAPYSPDLMGTTGIQVGDADGDGDLDLMVTTVANGVAMYYNDGARGFDFAHRLGIYWRPFDPYFADFDGDAVPDLATLVSAPGGLDQLALLPGLAGAIPTAHEDGTPDVPVAELPDGYAMSAGYPNPFNPQARLTLQLTEAQQVTVFDALGRRVAVLHDGMLAAETAHPFTLDGAALPSGLYVVRAVGEAFTASRVATLLK